MYRELRDLAWERNITIQELFRAVILPEWQAREGGTGKQETLLKTELVDEETVEIAVTPTARRKG